ncbi:MULTISPECIES: hypothetical protein [unclassified Streptomyces]|uniref:hypothetical protein n=1 Tax=unclassified Streptomyces TaxID=2593676 RepID=UPI0034249190
MTADTPLSIHVHTAPMRPIPSKPLGPGYEPRWSPCSSTLIAGERDASAMLELHGDRDNPHTLWFSAAQTIAKRG